MNTTEAVKIVHLQSTCYNHCGCESLHHELCAIFHTNKIVSHAGKVQDNGRASYETKRKYMFMQPYQYGLVIIQDSYAEKQ